MTVEENIQQQAKLAEEWLAKGEKEFAGFSTMDTPLVNRTNALIQAAKLLEEKDKLLEMMAEYLQGSLNFGVHDATGNINMDIWAKELLAKIAASKTKGE